MPNAFDFKCPACGNDDQLDILASIWIRLTEDGTDPDAATNGDHEWNEHSAFSCTACGVMGKVANLEDVASLLCQGDRS